MESGLTIKQASMHAVNDNENFTIERPTFVTHLECAMEGDHYPADQIHNLSKANKPLLVRYDLAEVKKALTKEALMQRPPDLWRYRELLPVRLFAECCSVTLRHLGTAKSSNRSPEKGKA